MPRSSRWATVQALFASIRAEVGNPPVDLLTPTEFAAKAGYGLGYFWGRADIPRRVITVRKSLPDDKLKNVLWHELAHILFPSKPHWWIECMAEVMAPSETGRYARRYAKSPADLPPKAELLRLARLSATRLQGV